MAKRISSMLSLASFSSGRSSNGKDDESHRSSASRPSSSSRNQAAAKLTRKSTPDLRLRATSAPTIDSPTGLNPRTSPIITTTNTPLSPMLEEFGDPLQPPILKPPPDRRDSLGYSRPTSRGGRPDSRTSVDTSGGSKGESQPTTPSTPSKYRSLTPTIAEHKLVKKRSWLPMKSRTTAQGGSEGGGTTQAWMITPQDKIIYDLSPLIHFQRVPELWNENGDTVVYLHARQDSRGPSFKINSAEFAASRKLTFAAHGGTRYRALPPTLSSDWRPRASLQDSHGRKVSEPLLASAERTQHVSNMNDPSSPLSPAGSRTGSRPSSRSHSRSPSRPPSRPGSSSNQSSSRGILLTSDFFEDNPRRDEIQLCVPQSFRTDYQGPESQLVGDDVETLVAIRNMFAFLSGQPLVATTRNPSIFSIFLRISDLLQQYQFTNLDGSTLGEDANTLFGHYITDFKLADVRSSREKTIEAIILGERMKSTDLYNEGFVHGAGKYEEITDSGIPKIHQISELSRLRVERANLDLSTRLRNVRIRLDDFDFPGLFAGSANSTTNSDSKVVRFKAWKGAFMSMRRYVMGFYKHRYGAWPPRAKSRKNNFEESGLNRLLLREVYQDFSDLYDVLVDRTSLTTRFTELPSDEGSDDPEEPAPRALRRILDEYDRSTPPVQPPIPFDTPMVPTLFSTRRNFDTLDLKKQRKESTKKIRDGEINTALMQSYNRDSMKSTTFLESFFGYERHIAHGKSIDEIADLRHGQWIFMYAVLQSLPLVVVDAPGLRCTDGVEYFLCEVPQGSPPWMGENHTQMQTYRVAGQDRIISLPAAVVEHGVEGIYRNSHCWEVAEKWIADAAGPGGAGMGGQWSVPFDELLPPTMPAVGSRPGSRTGSPDRRSMALGLEHLPLPPGLSPTASRPVSVHDPLKSFDSILGTTKSPMKAKKK